MKRTARWGCGTILALACLAPSSLANEPTVLLTAGQTLVARRLALTSDGVLTVELAQGAPQRYPIEQVAQVSFRAEVAERRPAPHRLVLQDGSRLRGTLRAIAGSQLRFVWGRRTLDVPLSAVRLVGMGDAGWASIGGIDRPHLVWRAAGTAPTAARAVRYEADALTADGAPVDLAKLAAVHFPVTRTQRSAEGWYARAMTGVDELLIGRVIGIDDARVHIETADLGPLELARAAVWKLVWGPPPDPNSLGFTLVAESHGQRAALFDPSGRLLWELTDLDKPHDVEPLPDGSLLIAEYKGGRVRKVQRSGKTLWEVARLRNPIDVDALPNGHVLVTEFSAGRLLEYDAKGRLVWQWDGLKYPNEADPIGDGSKVLVCESGNRRVFIADRKTKRILWEYKDLKWPMDADLLPDGNVLITDNNAHQVKIVSRSGKVIWAYSCRNPYEADRLRNGNVLIVETGRSRIIEVDRAKKIVWKLEGLKYPVAVTRY